MTQQILFIGGPLDRRFEDVETPLPTNLPTPLPTPLVTNPPTGPLGDGVIYTLHYISENVNHRGERRWPVYVCGPLPPASEVLGLWWVRATIWQPVTPRPAPGGAHLR